MEFLGILCLLLPFQVNFSSFMWQYFIYSISGILFHQEHECLVEGPLNNLKQSMVQFQKPKKVTIRCYRCYFIFVILFPILCGFLLSSLCNFTWVIWLLWHRFTMNGDYSMVVEQVLFPMIILDLLPQAQILIGGVLALGVCC